MAGKTYKRSSEPPVPGWVRDEALFYDADIWVKDFWVHNVTRTGSPTMGEGAA